MTFVASMAHMTLIDLLNRIIPLCTTYDRDEPYPYYVEELSDGSKLWFEPSGNDFWESDGAEEYAKSKLGDDVYTAQIYRALSINGDSVMEPSLFIAYKCESVQDTWSSDECREPWGNGIVTDVIVYGGENYPLNGLKDKGYDLRDSLHFGVDMDYKDGKNWKPSMDYADPGKDFQYGRAWKDGDVPESIAVTHWFKVDAHIVELIKGAGYIEQMTKALLEKV